MKKIFVIIAALLILCALLVGCGGESGTEKEGLRIVCTVFPQYDFAKALTEGREVSVSMLLTAGAEPHSYDPTPDDMVSAAECDLFICVGGESEAWAQKLISAASIGEDRILRLLDVIPPMPQKEHGHDHSEYDEHVWTSPKNAILIAEAIAERLISADPEGAESYGSNLSVLKAKLGKLDSAFTELGEKSEGELIVFGDPFPFGYLMEEYGLEYVSPYKGCGAHAEASVGDIASVIDDAREAGASKVFAVDFSNGKLAKTIAEELDATVLRLYSCHTVSADLMRDGESYLSLMEKNLKSLEEAFGTND